MKYNYTLLAPLMSAYVDDGTRDLVTAQCTVEGVGDFRITVIGRPSAAEMIRSEMIGGDGQYTREQALIESQLVEHMLSSLRLATDQHVEHLWFGQERMLISTDGDSEGMPRLTTRLASVSVADHEEEFKKAGLLFEQTIDRREMFKLLSDTKQPTLPLPYRYLSVYKVLEKEFKIGKKWPGLPELLSQYEAEYRSLNISGRSLENYIHEVRDLCAHIKLDNSSATLGITGLKNEDFVRVERLFYLLKKIVLQHLTTVLPIQVDHASPQHAASDSPVRSSELKAHLDRVYDNDQADELEREAARWDHEARNRPKALADAFTECALQARKLASLIRLSGVRR
ncbi:MULTISPECIES: hypothetical protein [unclassified Bradyrhizobium]